MRRSRSRSGSRKRRQEEVQALLAKRVSILQPVTRTERGALGRPGDVTGFLGTYPVAGPAVREGCVTEWPMRSRRGSATKSLTLWCTPKNNSKWRERSRKRSQSRTPFHLSEKDRMEQLEIAKANAAKSLGIANLDWSASLRTVPVAKETNYGTPVPNAAKFEVSIPGIFKQNLQNSP